MKTESESIIKTISETLDVPIEDIKGRNRKREAVDARNICYSMIKKFVTGSYLTFKKIGNVFDRDHSTVINGLNRVNELLNYDREFKTKYRKCEEALLHFSLDFCNRVPQL